MKHIQNIIMFVAALGLLSLSGLAQNQKPSSPPEDKVYTAKEVDKKAVITNWKELDPERLGAATDCRSGTRVVVKAILRKSGDVTDIKVISPASCSMDEKVEKSISHAKFRPALKNGVAVSQYIEVKYRRN